MFLMGLLRQEVKTIPGAWIRTHVCKERKGGYNKMRREKHNKASKTQAKNKRNSGNGTMYSHSHSGTATAKRMQHDYSRRCYDALASHHIFVFPFISQPGYFPHNVCKRQI